MWIQIIEDCRSKWNPTLTAGQQIDLDYDSAKSLISCGMAFEIPPQSVPSSGGEQSVEVDFSTADLLTGDTVAKLAIPALGENQIAFVWRSFLEFIPGSQPFGQASEGASVVVGYAENVNDAQTMSSMDFSRSDRGYTPFLSQGLYGSVANAAGQPVYVGLNSAVNLGSISGTAIRARGTGYAPGDTQSLTENSGDAIFTVDTVDGDGAVLTGHISSPGLAYASATGLTTANGGSQPGSGTGLTLDITSIVQGNGSAKLKLYYTVETVA